MTETKISFLIPAYNSCNTLREELPGFISYLKNFVKEPDIIIINDGGQDRDAIELLGREFSVTVLQHTVNRGKGHAIRSGFAYAKGAFVIYTDADIPFAYANVQNMLQLLCSGKADMVVGDRTLPDSVYYIHSTFVRKIGSRLISWLAGRMISSSIKDSQCGLKGFTRKAAEQTIPICRSSRFAIDFEILYMAFRSDLRVEKIPVQLRNQAKSTVSPIGDGLRMLWDILFTMKRVP
jgi:dolichyl-phosphate beta-glucosyltransferase